MILLDLLFGTWTGILSLFTIVFMIGMFAFLFVFLLKNQKKSNILIIQ